MINPNSPYCMAASTEGVYFDNPLPHDQAEIVDAAGIRIKEGENVFPRCLNSLDYQINCPLALIGSSFVGECALGKTILQAEGPPKSVPGVYREPGEGLLS